MPCTTFSRARKDDGRGPGPLRDDQHKCGLPLLSKVDRAKVQNGNSLYAFFMRLLRVCEKCQVPYPYVVENPRSRLLWDMLPLQRFITFYRFSSCFIVFIIFPRLTYVIFHHCFESLLFSIISLTSSSYFMIFSASFRKQTEIYWQNQVYGNLQGKFILVA